jgi:hypothetical protein
MKNFVRVAVLAVLAWVMAIGLQAPSVSAQQFPGYTSGIQVQNLTGEEAEIILTFYKGDGTIDETINDTIPGNGSKTYFGGTLTVSEGFNGAAVISSNRQIAAISNMLNDSFTAGAAYVASSAGSTSVQLPLLQFNNSGFNSWVTVQNAGSGPAAVTVTYSDGVTANANIPQGSSHTFYQDDEAHPANGALSGVVTSDKPVVAVVVQENASTIFAYTGFTEGSTNPVLPLINANNSGFVTGAQIQNAGTQATEVVVTYTPSLVGTACTETQTIPAGQSKTFAFFAFANGADSTCTPGERFVGSARVSANSNNQPLGVIVNQLSGSTTGEAYGAFNPASATNRVVMPLIMDRNSGYFTGFNVLNVGTTATTVNCTFTNTGYTASAELQPGGALTDLQAEKIAAGYVGGATCTAGTGGQIVGVVNELSGAGGDQFLVYEGINN